MLKIAAAIAMVFCCSINHAVAAATPLQRERVVAVLTGGEVQLERTGKAAFLNMLVLDNHVLEAWLSEHLLQQEITFTARGDDRYGRTQITSDVEVKMLRDGVAMIYASTGDIPANWRLAEAAARNAKRGVWAMESLLITPEAALKATGGFHVIEGSITRIYESKTATYLNFGDDWRSDFSITVLPKQRRSMKAFLANLKAGDRVRVRGSITQENGPMIRLNHPANLERL